MRVAYLASQYPAPSHTFIRREVLALRARGVAVETFSIRPPREGELNSDADEDAKRTTFYVLPVGAKALLQAHGRALTRRPARYLETLALALRHRAPGLKELLWSFFYFLEAIRLAEGLEEKRVEHVHNHFANAGANVGMLAAHFLSLPWSFTIHGISEFDYPAGYVLASKVARAKFVACASYFVQSQAMRVTHPVHWHKFVIVRCGIDLAKLPSPRRIPHPQGKLRIVSVGRLSPEKGQSGLIEAMATLKERGIPAELVLIGEGPERGHLESLVTKHDLAANVMLPGSAGEAETLEVVAVADVYVCSSLMEGLPVSLMESLALDIPTIAPRIAGIPELIDDGENGLLFTPGRFDEMCERLIRLASDPDLRAHLRARGRLKVEAQHDAKKVIAPLLARFTRTT